MTLSQDTFELILQGVSQDIKDLLKDCCNVTVISLERSQVETQQTNDEQQGIIIISLSRFSFHGDFGIYVLLILEKQ